MYCIDEFICCVCFAQVTIVNNVEEVRMHVLIKYVVLRVHLHVCSYSKGQPLRCTFVSEECTFQHKCTDSLYARRNGSGLDKKIRASLSSASNEKMCCDLASIQCHTHPNRRSKESIARLVCIIHVSAVIIESRQEATCTFPEVQLEKKTEEEALEMDRVPNLVSQSISFLALMLYYRFIQARQYSSGRHEPSRCPLISGEWSVARLR